MVAVVAVVLTAGAFGVTGSNTITTIAGTGVQGFSGDGGPATSARLDVNTRGVAVDGQGNLYITAVTTHRVRKVDTGGTITTFAGTTGGFSGDGLPAIFAQMNGPIAVAVDGQGNIYIADSNNARVRKVSPGGIITTFAGTGVPGFSGDGGPATAARLYAPTGLAADGQGNIYIVDTYNHRVRKVDSGGTITTFAGNGTGGFSGDGGPATSAQLGAYPEYGVAADANGDVYIADPTNHRVRKVSGGTITTFAGGGPTRGDGGPATAGRLATPEGLAVDGQGNLYIADSADYRVRKVDTGGTITTIVGTGSGVFNGDGGPAASATVFAPAGLALDGGGNLYIADRGNYRVRKVLNTEVAAQSIAFAALANKTYGDPDFTVSATASSGLAVSFAASGNCTLGGTTVHITGAGSCMITASQPGGGGYPAAPSVSRTFSIAKASQTITVSTHAPANTAANTTFTVAATAPGGAVSYSSGGVCSNSGATFTMASSSGTCSVKYDQSGNANYNAATQVTESVAVTVTVTTKLNQTIVFGPLANKTYGAADFTVTASASSRLAVSFAASGNCTVSGSTVHLTSPGSCTITASQPGNASYNAAPAVSQTFSIARRFVPPTRCRVPNVVGKRLGAAKFAIKRSHCRTGKVGYAHSRKRKKGIVVSQSRRPGRVLPANSKINLVVSRGPRP